MGTSTIELAECKPEATEGAEESDHNRHQLRGFIIYYDYVG